jgi:ABC-type sugar transport system permease subunit
MTTSAGTVIAPARARTATAIATVRRNQGFQHGGWFVAPFLVLFALFVVWPLLRGVYLSLTDANISGDGASFIGLDNYREALHDRAMWDALGHSAYFTLLVVPCITVLAFLLAMLAHHIERGKWLWRLCFFAPFLLPSTVAGNLWQWLFTQGIGLFNHVLRPHHTLADRQVLRHARHRHRAPCGGRSASASSSTSPPSRASPTTSTRPPSWTARTPGTARSTSPCRCCATSPAW